MQAQFASVIAVAALLLSGEAFSAEPEPEGALPGTRRMSTSHNVSAMQDLNEMLVGAVLVRVRGVTLGALGEQADIVPQGVLYTSVHPLHYAAAEELGSDSARPFNGELVVPELTRQRLVKHDGQEFFTIPDESRGSVAELKDLMPQKGNIVLLVRKDPRSTRRYFVRHAFAESREKLNIEGKELSLDSLFAWVRERSAAPQPELWRDPNLPPSGVDPYDPPEQGDPDRSRRSPKP